MYYRIIKELSWPEIELAFGKLFDPRTTDGLTSVYYRVRKSWGEVSKTESTSVNDRNTIELQSVRFSKAFLIELGYCDGEDV